MKSLKETLTYIISKAHRGAVLVGALIGLGVLVIVLPLIYLISVTVANTTPTGGLSAAQSSTMQTLVNNGGSALQLTSTAETVVGAGIIILAIYLFMMVRNR